LNSPVNVTVVPRCRQIKEAHKEAHLTRDAAAVVDYCTVAPELDHCAHRRSLLRCSHNSHALAQRAEGRQRLAAKTKGLNLAELLKRRKLGCVVFQACG
jgi:hypothetical protein